MFKEEESSSSYKEGMVMSTLLDYIYIYISLADSCNLSGMVEFKYTAGGKEIQCKCSLIIIIAI